MPMSTFQSVLVGEMSVVLGSSIGSMWSKPKANLSIRRQWLTDGLPGVEPNRRSCRCLPSGRLGGVMPVQAREQWFSEPRRPDISRLLVTAQDLDMSVAESRQMV